MIWNTIAHPRMMHDTGGITIPEADTTIEGIKYADPHKLAFFDLLVDATDDDNPKLIHGDFETIKNKILNHELVVGGWVSYDAIFEDLQANVQICSASTYNKNSNDIRLRVLPSPSAKTPIKYIVSSDNTVSRYHDPLDDVPNHYNS